jgi:hypothetical protein
MDKAEGLIMAFTFAYFGKYKLLLFTLLQKSSSNSVSHAFYTTLFLLKITQILRGPFTDALDKFSNVELLINLKNKKAHPNIGWAFFKSMLKSW